LECSSQYFVDGNFVTAKALPASTLGAAGAFEAVAWVAIAT
jgi:hypothetical protein